MATTTAWKQVTFPGSFTTAWIPPDIAAGYADFDALPYNLRGMGTHVIYLAPTSHSGMWHLAGPWRGREGVRLANQLLGDQNWPFDLVLTESPYIMGAEIERVNVSKREFNLGVIIGGHAPPMSEYQFRMAEGNWWGGQDENNDGWVGIYTRFTGWRWIPVRPNTTVKTPQKMDSTAFGNNACQYDITWYAVRPYFTKPALWRPFEAAKAGASRPPPGANVVDGVIDSLTGNNFYWGTLPLANRGDMDAPVQYLVSSPGQAIVQDNNSNRLVTLPYTSAADGTYLCDTDDGKRTLTGAGDPVDNLFFKIARSSQILDFFLHDLDRLGLPLQLRWTQRFLYTIPPRSTVQLTVGHSEPNGTITAIVPQRFKRSR